MPLNWPDLTLPPINLWNAPHQEPPMTQPTIHRWHLRFLHLAQQAEEDNHQLLQLIAKIRAAAGDPHGKMMQPELIAHIQEMRDVLIQERADMRRTGGGISADTIGRMQAVIVAAGGGK